MTPAAGEGAWWMLTPAGALRAFGQPEPSPVDLALQALLGGRQSLSTAEWLAAAPAAAEALDEAQQQAWVERLAQPIEGPDTRLADFIQHVISGLSARRSAALASDGFCLGQVGLDPAQAEVLSAATADFDAFAARQARRGWNGAQKYVSFCSDAQMLMPDTSFVPFWVDGTSYWLVLGGEPLLNSPALVELLWGIKEAGSRFTAER